MNDKREREAANAYLKFIQAKGATSSILYKKSFFLDRLTESLVGKAQERTEYGQALEEVLKAFPTDEKYDCQNTAREFHPFWMNDIKAIAAFELYYGFDIHCIKWKPLHTSLKALTHSLDTELFDNNENLSLNTYSQALYSFGAEKLLVDTRIKFAKIILIRLRDAPIKNNKIYRMAVDITLPLFKINEIRQLFLGVMREFYYFWINDPEARKKVIVHEANAENCFIAAEN